MCNGIWLILGVQGELWGEDVGVLAEGLEPLVTWVG